MQKSKILIVEDDVVICKVYADELKDVGFSVITAGNGKEGLEVALSEKPDLILLDILMPVMDGLSMMDKLRHHNDYGKNVPIILLTNLSANEERVIHLITKNQPAYYLIKADWKLEEVVRKVKERLGQKEGDCLK